MPSAVRSDRIVSLARDFVADESCGPAARLRVGSLGALTPEDALACCQGATLAWAMTHLPGTYLEVRGGALVAAR